MHRAFVFLVGLAAFPAALSAQNAPAGMTLELSFSPRAAAELARLGEGVTAVAYYNGEARPAHRRQASDDGLISLGEENASLAAGSSRIVFSGRAYRADRRSWVVTPSVDVNVFSARRASRDNILNCGLVSGALADLAGRVHPVRCTLIGE